MTSITSSAEPSAAIERAGPPRIVPLVADQPAMREWANELGPPAQVAMRRLRYNGIRAALYTGAPRRRETPRPS